jgi:hypothetical protein
MVGSANPLLAGAQSSHRTATQMLAQPNPRSRSESLPPHRGAGCQKKPSSKKEGEVFSLDISFYRTPLTVRAATLRMKVGPPARFFTNYPTAPIEYGPEALLL